MLRHPSFVAGEATTTFIDRYFSAGSDDVRRPQPDLRTLALAAVLLFEARTFAAANEVRAARNWSSTGIAIWPLRLTLGEIHHPANIMAVRTDVYLVALGKDMVELSVEERSEGAIRFTAMGLQQTACFALHEGVLHLDLNGLTVAVRETVLETGGSARREGSSRLLAPMNGAIIGVYAKRGDSITKGQRIVVLEAMKMQHEICAERAGTIDKVLVKPGDQVATRQLLVELTPEASATQDRMEATQ